MRKRRFGCGISAGEINDISGFLLRCLRQAGWFSLFLQHQWVETLYVLGVLEVSALLPFRGGLIVSGEESCFSRIPE